MGCEVYHKLQKTLGKPTNTVLQRMQIKDASIYQQREKSYAQKCKRTTMAEVPTKAKQHLLRLGD